MLRGEIDSFRDGEFGCISGSLKIVPGSKQRLGRARRRIAGCLPDAKSVWATGCNLAHWRGVFGFVCEARYVVCRQVYRVAMRFPRRGMAH